MFWEVSMKRLVTLAKQFLNDVVESIGQPQSPRPSGGDVPAELSDTNKFSADDLEALAATDIFKTPPKTDPNDDKYWWCFEGNELDATPSLKDIDSETIYAELNRKIEANEFPVIEIPDTVMRTMQLLNNPEFDFAEVAGVVNRSPAMAGEFLKIANSSLYSRGVEVRDLRTALPRLGRKNLKAMLFMYSSKLSLADNPVVNELAVSIVDHSYATALIAGYLSQRFYPDPDSAFFAGLLHDIGKLGILRALSQQKRTFEIDETSEAEDFSMNDAVEQLFPTLHEKAGRFLGENWKLDETVLDAIEHHHDFRDTGFEDETQLSLHLSCLINLSDSMARILGMGRRIGRVNIFGEEACVELNIEKNIETIEFLEDIPKIIDYKTSEASEKNAETAEDKDA